MELITRTTRTVRGRPASTPPRKLPGTYDKGRVCSRPFCNQPLSIYNRGPGYHRHPEAHQTEQALKRTLAKTNRAFEIEPVTLCSSDQRTLPAQPPGCCA